MGKKSSKKISIIYLIGMLLVAVGFVVPMFKGKLFGTTTNGFDFIDFNHFGFVTIAALLIFIGALCGVVFSFVSLKKNELVKVISLAVSIVGGIILVIGFNQDAVYQFIGKGFFSHAYIGFYMILVGWVVSLCGIILKK